MELHKVQTLDAFGMQGHLTIRSFPAGAISTDGVFDRQKLQGATPEEVIGPLKNKVVSSTGYGRNLILQWMTGLTTYPIVINSAALGDGTVAPADADVALGNSLVSAIGITNTSVSNNILTVEVFIPDASLANATYKEFGLFATLRLISRLLITPNYAKTAGKDTLLTYTLTMSG